MDTQKVFLPWSVEGLMACSMTVHFREKTAQRNPATSETLKSTVTSKKIFDVNFVL